jgi:hypothetical protein
MAYGVTEVQKVSQTAFPLVLGDDVGLESGRGKDRGLEGLLDSAEPRVVGSVFRLDSGQYCVRIPFQRREYLFARNCSSLLSIVSYILVSES